MSRLSSLPPIHPSVPPPIPHSWRLLSDYAPHTQQTSQWLEREERETGGGATSAGDKIGSSTPLACALVAGVREPAGDLIKNAISGNMYT